MTRKPLNRERMGLTKAMSTPPSTPISNNKQKKDLVNMNLRAEREHRQHWKVEAARRGEDLSSVIRDYLAHRYGLLNKQAQQRHHYWVM